MVVQEIIDEAGRLFHVHPRDITGPSRYGFIIPARFALYAALHRRRCNSYSQVGRWMCRDHSTVLHGKRMAERRAEKDPDYAARIQHLVDYKGAASIPAGLKPVYLADA